MGVYSFKKQRLRGIIGTSSMKILSNYIRIKDLSYTKRLDKLIYDHWKKKTCPCRLNWSLQNGSLSAIPFEDLFKFDNSGRSRGNSLKLMKKRCQLDLRLYFFSERAVNVRNSLDDQSVTASSLNSFKSTAISQDLEDSRWVSSWTTLFSDPRGCPVYWSASSGELYGELYQSYNIIHSIL